MALKKNSGVVAAEEKKPEAKPAPKAQKVTKPEKTIVPEVSAAQDIQEPINAVPEKISKKQLALVVSGRLKEKGMAAPASVLEAATDILFSTIAGEMKKGNTVSITGFGLFQGQHKEASVRHNPRNPDEKIQVPACVVPKFKAAKALKDSLK